MRRIEVSQENVMDIDVERLGDQGLGDNDSNDQESHASWRSLNNFTDKAHIIPLILALILSVASGVVVPALAIFLGKIFDVFTSFGAGEISGPDLVKKVSTYGIALAGLGSASGLLHAGYFMLWLVFGELQAKSAREKLFDAMLEKDMAWYDMRKAGIDTLISRMQTHIRELQIATSQPLGFAVQYTLTTFVALGLAFYYSWSLTLVTLSTVPLLAFVLRRISAKMQPSIKAQVDELTKASRMANNAISAIETVKSFNGQDLENWQYAKSVKNAARHYLVQAQANALQIGFVRLITLGMFVQGFWYGSHLVNTGQKNPGEILTAFWACLMATQAVEQILPQVIVLERGRAAGATLKAIMIQMERGRKIVSMNGRTAPSYCDGDIEIRNVSFCYPSRPDYHALKDATFFFPAGETTFIVGKSGSGKSTLGNLLMRFYSTEHGDLLIDGNPIQTLDMNWLRNNVTLVQQQSVLFNETIFKNIAFGRRDHSRVRKEDVKGAIEVATLQHTISDLPLGLDTVVGTGGNAMSGGQKQRVALARARLRDTPILILDEATSALDHMSKMSVVDAIRKWRNGKTTLIITHDMEQIQEGDYVYVLDKGNIVQEGFKHTFEKTALGPSRNLSTAAINMKPRRRIFPKRTLSSESIFSLISPTSDASEDPLDIEIKPRKTLIPSVFGQQPEDKFQHTPRELPSPFSPAGFPMHRGSVATWSPKLRQRDLAKLSEIPEPVSPPWTQDLRAVEMTERSTKNASRLDTTVQQGRNAQIIQSPIGPPTRSISSTALTIERTKTSWKRKPTRADKARHIAPLKKILMTIWPALTWSRRGILILGFFCAAIHAAATPTFSWVFSKLLATFYLTDHHGRSRIALKWSLTVLGIATVDSLAAYFMHYLLERCGQAWVDALRAEALKRVLDQPRSWFERDKNSLTRLTECLDRNAEEMRNLLGRFAGFVFVAITMMSIAVIWSLILSWKLTLVGLASAPFMYTVTRSFELISGRWETKSDKAASSANAIFIETFSNIRTVRVLTLESYFHNKYAKAVSETFKVGLRRSAYSGFFFGLSDSGIIFVTALIFYYGAVLASSKEYSTQDILTVFTMLLFSIANANAIIAFVPQINSSRSTATQLLRLAHLPSEASHEHTGHIRLSHPGPMVFKDTAFSYPTRPTFPVLSRLNLTIKPGTSTALVGASGCGKSTIASLLLGLYPLNSGTLSFNGVSMNDIHLPTLRSLTSIVPQQPILFATTVAHNIAYALPESSPFCNLDSIRSAARAAGIDDFICTLPLGYDTLIGDGGTGLSGGQAQRIAIARAVVRKPKLLILDEATSGLDGETARGVRDMMKNLERQGVGVIVVTHERAMMEGCTEIVVLKDGAVAEKGRFRELLLRGGELTRLLGGGGEGR